LSDQRAALEHATGSEAGERRRDIEQRIHDIARELTPLAGEPTARHGGATLTAVSPPVATMACDAKSGSGGNEMSNAPFAQSEESSIVGAPISAEHARDDAEAPGELDIRTEGPPADADERRQAPPSEV
jgi:hypothetical protein